MARRSILRRGPDVYGVGFSSSGRQRAPGLGGAYGARTLSGVRAVRDGHRAGGGRLGDREKRGAHQGDEGAVRCGAVGSVSRDLFIHL